MHKVSRDIGHHKVSRDIDAQLYWLAAQNICNFCLSQVGNPELVSANYIYIYISLFHTLITSCTYISIPPPPKLTYILIYKYHQKKQVWPFLTYL